MKDKVFIAWSGSNDIAMKVKRIMEGDGSYLCSIGGNSDNNSAFSSIGDTVIQQIKNCNQAIVIFQNRKDGAVSNNLFFELGYVLARYGQRKVHCVRKSSEAVVLPSDFDNSFVEPIEYLDDNDFAQRIVDYFISRQKMSVNENKMFLINNRYLMHDMIESHFSKSGSKCSDYELAQYVLFYMNAAHMFKDERRVYQEILRFKDKHGHEFSPELLLASNVCLSYLKYILAISVDEESGNEVVDKATFREGKTDLEGYLKGIVPDNSGIFDEWARVFVCEDLAYLYMLYAENHENSDSLRRMLYQKCIEYVDMTLESIGMLEQVVQTKENNDDIGILSIVRCYVYRNRYICERYLGLDERIHWLELTLNERASLKRNFSKGTVDSVVYESIISEYYLTVSELLTECELHPDLNLLDDLDKMMYLDEIDDFLRSVKGVKDTDTHIEKIEHYRMAIKGVI